jgi:hypothetical protein
MKSDYFKVKLRNLKTHFPNILVFEDTAFLFRKAVGIYISKPWLKKSRHSSHSGKIIINRARDRA